MKLYIKSVDIPLSCGTCVYQDYDEDDYPHCRINGGYAVLNEKRTDCPLITLPQKYSRLVDVDEVKNKLIKYGFKAPDMTVTEFVEDELSTIIESEGE